MARTETEPGLPRTLVAAGVIVGVALRAVLLTTSLGRPDADEVIGGLMARHLTTDPFPLWYWGQHYGGTPEIVVVAASLRLFGSSVLAMRLPTVLMGAGCCLLLWRVARRVVSERQAQLAGLLMWVWSPSWVWLSVREMMFYVPTVLVGLTMVLCGQRIRDGGGWREWTVGGVAAVLGLWMNPTIAYYLLPALAVVGAPWPRRLLGWLQRARAARDGLRLAGFAIVVAGLVGLVVGGVVLVRDVSRQVPEIAEFTRFDQHPTRVAWFFTDGLPGLLGLREMFTYRWVLGPVGVAVYVLALGALALGTWRGIKVRAWDSIGLLAFPLVFGLVPRATDQPNMRYLSFAIPFVVLALVRAVAVRRVAAVPAVVAAVLVTLVGFQRIYVVSEVERTVRVGNVGDLEQAIAIVEAEGITEVYANYWVAFRISFESEERIIAAAPFEESRYPPYLDEVRASSRPAWVVEANHQIDDLRTSLGRIGVTARELPAGEFVVVIPDRLVRTEELGPPARGGI